MRDVMLYITLTLNVVSMGALIAGILMHSGRGGGLSDMFGGGGGGGARIYGGRAEPQPDHVRVCADLAVHRDGASVSVRVIAAGPGGADRSAR